MPSNALDYITIKGFKSIASVQRLELKPINVVIGPNGSGKSNFIGVFSFLHAIREDRLGDHVAQAGGAEKMLHFGSKETQQIHLHLSFENEVNQYDIRLWPTSEDALSPASEVVSYWDKPHHLAPYNDTLTPQNRGREAGISNEKADRITGWVRHRLGSWRVYHVHDTSSTSPMRKTAKVDDNAYLRPDGSRTLRHFYTS
jgi:predicted ATPase